MASNSTEVKKCATCMQNSDEQKIKPGIALCEGCHQTYCLPHFVEHRQALNTSLDGIAGQRDMLQSRIEELSTRMSKEHLKAIDDWKNMMLQTVIEAADNTRQEVHRLIISEMERECTELTSKITSFRANDNCFETDLSEVQTKIEKLDEELNDLSNLHRIQLNLPTLDCSKTVQIKSFATDSLPKIAENKDPVVLQPKTEYRSFIEHFLTTHQPSIDLPMSQYGSVCASPTMLIKVNGKKIERFVFHRQSASTFDWQQEALLDIRWSFWLQQFIFVTKERLVAVDAVEKESGIVVQSNGALLQHAANWRHLCLVADQTNRLFLYEMNKNLKSWFLSFCWSVPITCASGRNITAIGLNEHRIVLSIQNGDQNCFAVHKRDMTRLSYIQLMRPCTSIQALPQGEWLLFNSSDKSNCVIDSELEQHDEPYLSSMENVRLTINCEETDKILLTLLPTSSSFSNQKSIRVFTNNGLS